MSIGQNEGIQNINEKLIVVVVLSLVLLLLLLPFWFVLFSKIFLTPIEIISNLLIKK